MFRADGVSRPNQLRPIWRAVAAGVFLVFASGCTTPYEGRYDFYDGWRKAEVVRIERLEALPTHQIPHCRSAQVPAVEGSTWAVVRYRAGRRSRQVAVPLKQAEDFKVGELVYVNVSECGRDIRKRLGAT